MTTSYDDILSNDQITDLWGNVIKKAIDDLGLFWKNLEDGKVLTLNDWDSATSAYCFLFNDNYTVFIDDYHINVYCPKCMKIWSTRMSDYTKLLGKNDKQVDISCPLCKETTPWSLLTYKIDKNKKVKETTLKSLVSTLGYNNIETLREKAMKIIRQIVKES
ncbi:MAG: hypothetical protein KAX49_15290 [Halanaerobiales bacterium]|nr:hypothetical protein [Halanaerobiales bacterium]